MYKFYFKFSNINIINILYKHIKILFECII